MDIHLLIFGPKLYSSIHLRKKFHSMVSNALRKSVKRRIAGSFLDSVYSIMSLKSRTFCPINLPFMKPVWLEWISKESTFSTLRPRALAKILRSTLRRVSGRQLVNLIGQEPSFGIKQRTPRLWDIDNCPLLKASLYELSRCKPIRSKNVS